MLSLLLTPFTVASGSAPLTGVGDALHASMAPPCGSAAAYEGAAMANTPETLVDCVGCDSPATGCCQLSVVALLDSSPIELASLASGPGAPISCGAPDSPCYPIEHPPQ
ncbi:hypothetical protein D0544_02555 [Aestuariirhabdus litorea]|uniref:Uncharacterized protein n=2 Tax=Aestuariirhabdus litorea TaxID=2528527 RepID=A0A3P3VR66_9GAMM|nr:hypothetical protein D0544_02555 [Aestuariirhabdus litorea]